jgi:flavin-binding protein dodecin
MEVAVPKHSAIMDTTPVRSGLRRARAALAATCRRHHVAPTTEEDIMAVAKVTEIIASSPQSFEDAIQMGIARADKTLKNVRGAWIAEQKVEVEKGTIKEYRVTMRVTFVLEE